jgi:hypothetical protein
MIQINVVSRISEDKNVFFDLIYAIYQLQQTGINDVHILFIGEISNNVVYQDMRRLVKLFDLSSFVSFTKRSIWLQDLEESVKNGYFFNFTIGDFIGYSGVESVSLGYKTIFYNAETSLSDKTTKSVSMCPDIPTLISLITKIKHNPELMDKQIISDNLKMKTNFALKDEDKLFLRSILC